MSGLKADHKYFVIGSSKLRHLRAESLFSEAAMEPRFVALNYDTRSLRSL